MISGYFVIICSAAFMQTVVKVDVATADMTAVIATHATQNFAYPVSKGTLVQLLVAMYHVLLELARS